MSKPCPRCCGPFRETVNGVCQLCGKDYGEETRSKGLILFDSLTPNQAIAKAWLDPGRYPAVHARMQDRIRIDMPLLARALDRLPR